MAEIKQKLTVLSSSQRTDVPAEAVPGEHAQDAVSNFDSTVNNISIANDGNSVNSKDSNKNGTVTQVSNADKSTLNITPETPPVSPVPSDNNIANTEDHVKGAEARYYTSTQIKKEPIAGSRDSGSNCPRLEPATVHLAV